MILEMKELSWLKVLIRVRRPTVGQRRLYKRGREKISDEEVYEEVSNDTASLLKTINEVTTKARKHDDLKKNNQDYFIIKDPKLIYLLTNS